MLLAMVRRDDKTARQWLNEQFVLRVKRIERQIAKERKFAGHAAKRMHAMVKPSGPTYDKHKADYQRHLRAIAALNVELAQLYERGPYPHARNPD